MKKITLIPGDGIGYEISESLVKIFDAAKVPVEFETENAGSDVYEKTGELIPESLYESVERNKIAIKGPITTPIGKGFRSINVYLRKKYDLYTNFRPSRNLPGIETRYDNIDLAIFRENTEGIYIGEEKYENEEKTSAIAVKRITRKGSERIIRSAFEYAKNNGISKVTVVHKANILKFTDGMFLDIAREISKEYENIELEELIIDNMCMQLVTNPERFKVIVTMNLYGDISETPQKNIPVIIYSDSATMNGFKTIISKIKNKDLYALISEIRLADKSYQLILTDNTRVYVDTFVDEEKYNQMYRLYKKLKAQHTDFKTVELRYKDITTRQ